MKFPRWLRNQPTSWTFDTPKIEHLRFLPVQFSCKGPHWTSILEFPRNFWSRQSLFCYPVSNSTNLTQNKVAKTLKLSWRLTNKRRMYNGLEKGDSCWGWNMELKSASSHNIPAFLVPELSGSTWPRKFRRVPRCVHFWGRSGVVLIFPRWFPCYFIFVSKELGSSGHLIF